MSQDATLTRGHVGWSLFKLTLPMVIGMFSMVSYHLADTYFVSQLDEGLDEPIHLAAMGFTYPVAMVLMAVLIGLSHATSSVVSRAIGMGDRSIVRRRATDILLLAVLLTSALGAIGLSLIDPVFRLIGAGEDTLPLIRQYMTVWFLGTPAFAIPIIGNSCMRADGDSKFPALIMLIGSATNIALDPLLIFGLWGLPELGIAGAATATVIARSLGVVLSLSILIFRKRLLTRIRPRVSEVLASWKAVLYIAVPSAGTTLLFPLSMGVVTRLASGAGLSAEAMAAGDFGDPAVAAVGAGSRVESFVMMVLWAISTTLGPFIGQNWGAGKVDRVCHASRLAMAFSVGWGVVSLGLFLLLGRPIAHAFTDDPEVANLMVWYIWLIAAGLGFRGVCILGNTFFNAINRPLNASLIDVIRLFILTIPLAWAGSKVFGVYGVYGGVAGANILAGCFAGYWAGRTCRRCTDEAAAEPSPGPPREAEW